MQGIVNPVYTCKGIVGRSAAVNFNNAVTNNWIHRSNIILGFDKRESQLKAIRITSQPVGAMFDYLLNEKGEMPAQRRMAFKGEIGILGLGMNTVELLVVRNGSPVWRFTAGRKLGVRRLLELISHDRTYSLAELDAQLRHGSLGIARALPVWQSEVLGFIEMQWGTSFRRFGVVVVVGGGASLLREALVRRFKDRTFIPEDPIIATARGLYKYTLMQARRRRE